MKTGDLIRFTATGVIGVVVEVRDPKKNHEAPDLAGPSALVYHAWEDLETGTQRNESLWYYLDYLQKCSEPATFDDSAMIGGRL